MKYAHERWRVARQTLIVTVLLGLAAAYFGLAAYGLTMLVWYMTR